MKSVPAVAVPTEAARDVASRISAVDRLLRRVLFRVLRRLRRGRLTVIDAGGRYEFAGAETGPAATVRIRNGRAYRDLVFGGSLGAGEAYVRGDWVTDDLARVVRVMMLNRRVWDRMERWYMRRTSRLLTALVAALDNSVRRSRRNIAAHYDLSNDFFALFLDPTMTYSCALFERAEMTLEEASVAKIDRLCRKLRLGPEDHLLEIGTGWGALSIHAARTYGCRVTTTTISAEQHALAAHRIAEAGLEDRVTLLQQDYRELTGTYDKIVSVEMIEAVGHAHYETFFRKCMQLLAPNGLLTMQAITVPDQVYETHRRSVDFIKKYIFPGGCIPSVTALCGAVARATDLRLVHLEDITPFYAETLRRWRTRFVENADAIRRLGFPDEFLRMWECYLCYCEGGFIERYIGDVQLLFARPDHRGAPLLGAL